MNEIEITFNELGNTIVGEYTEYAKLDKAIARKSVFTPYGKTIRCDLATLRRLVEHVALFGHCIKTLAGFRKACELAGVELVEL